MRVGEICTNCNIQKIMNSNHIRYIDGDLQCLCSICYTNIDDNLNY